MRQRVVSAIWYLWLPVAAFLILWFGTVHTSSFYFPSFQSILSDFRKLWLFDHTRSDLLPSLERLANGYVRGVVGGALIGVLLGSVRRLEEWTRPLLEFIRAIPGIALLPIAMIFLGTGDQMKVNMIAYATIFPVMLNAISGVRGVEPLLYDVTRSYRLSRWEKFARVTLPGAAPQIVTGARVAVPLAVVVMVATEMVGTPGGIGYFIIESQQSFDLTGMWTGLLVLGLLGYIFNTVFLLLENRALSWQRAMEALAKGSTR